MDSLSDIAYEYFVEFETEKSCPHHFEGDPSILLFFQSWAFSVQFGGQHDLAKIAFHLKPVSYTHLTLPTNREV